MYHVHLVLPALTTVKVEPVGRWFEAYGLRRLRKQTLSTHSVESSSSEEDESDIAEEDTESEAYIRSLDPAEWKVTKIFSEIVRESGKLGRDRDKASESVVQ